MKAELLNHFDSSTPQNHNIVECLGIYSSHKLRSSWSAPRSGHNYLPENIQKQPLHTKLDTSVKY